jgi:hypothetical protein
MCAPPGAGASYDALRHRLSRMGVEPAAAMAPLEMVAAPADAPRVVEPVLLENVADSRSRITLSAATFAAFLDGTQASRVLFFVDGVAVVHGTVAAVIRQRSRRRLTTWRQLVRRGIYAPRGSIPDSAWRMLEATGERLTDTSSESPPGDAAHPFVLRDAAIHRIQQDRESLERLLAAQWRESGEGTLLVDGSVGDGWVGSPPRAVGVVKSHRSLYSRPADLRAIFQLGAAERSPAFRLTSSWQQPVVSWYLRLREPVGRDPMWSLVRIEIAESEAVLDEVRQVADAVSGWVLAEAAPLSLPDTRWDKLMYGVHDCEQFLKAVV